MNLSAIHKTRARGKTSRTVVCDIGGYEFVSYSQAGCRLMRQEPVVCDIGGYEFVSYSQEY